MNNNLHILTKNNLPGVIIQGESCAVLLLQESVYLLLQPLSHSLTLYVLEDDLQARGISNEQIPSNIELINYAKFVDLIASFDKSTTWY
jgi:sulfur relay protein TusB/DsrH